MQLSDAFELGWRVAAVNKLRFGLSVVGVIIGVAAVVIVVAVGNAGRAHIERELETFGKNSVWIWRDPENRKKLDQDFWLNPHEITERDFGVITRGIQEVEDVAGVLSTSAEMDSLRNRKNVNVVGVSERYFALNNDRLAEGRFFTPYEQNVRDRVAILSGDSALSVLGGEITLNDEKFRVVGILSKKDRPLVNLVRSGGEEENLSVYVPLHITQRWKGTRNFQYIQVQAKEGMGLLAGDRVKKLLKVTHGGMPDFRVETMEQYVHASNRIVGVIQLVLGFVALISLLVGGIGIMNVMLVSVTERTREIGVRKAVGARKEDILSQFIAESVLITTIGGVGGMFLAAVLVSIASVVSGISGLFYWPALVMALVTAIVVGVSAGLYPAWRAALLDPAVALRHD